MGLHADAVTQFRTPIHILLFDLHVALSNQTSMRLWGFWSEHDACQSHTIPSLPLSLLAANPEVPPSLENQRETQRCTQLSARTHTRTHKRTRAQRSTHTRTNRQTGMQNAPSSKHESYDIVWRHHALGLNFTPNERDRPVICQVPPNSSPDVLQSPAAVGDVLIAFQLHGQGGRHALEQVESFDQVMEVLQEEELPITLRFASRKDDIPERVAAAEISETFTFTWQPQQPLGVSLAMDPCSLHTAITRIDPQKISPEFLKLDPKVGDVLVSVRGSGDYSSKSVHLDHMRFEDIIGTLREFPRPSQLTFARLVEDQDAARSPPVSPSTARHQHQEQQKLQPLQPMHPCLRPMPLASRQSFRVDKPIPVKLHDDVPKSYPPSAASPAVVGGDDPKKEANKFYKVIYAGGRVGLQLRDCSKEDSEKEKKDLRTSKTKGYSVCIKEVTDAKSAPGLENGSPGDLLMAIGHRDLQLLSFEQVHHELAQIRTPTELLFKKRTVAGGSSGGSLVDALFLFLI